MSPEPRATKRVNATTLVQSHRAPPLRFIMALKARRKFTLTGNTNENCRKKAQKQGSFLSFLRLFAATNGKCSALASPNLKPRAQHRGETSTPPSAFFSADGLEGVFCGQAYGILGVGPQSLQSRHGGECLVSQAWQNLNGAEAVRHFRIGEGFDEKRDRLVCCRRHFAEPSDL